MPDNKESSPQTNGLIIEFATGKSEITDEHKKALQELAEFCVKNGYIPSAISGYASPVGNKSLNKTLSQQRASNTKQAFAEIYKAELANYIANNKDQTIYDGTAQSIINSQVADANIQSLGEAPWHADGQINEENKDDLKEQRIATIDVIQSPYLVTTGKLSGVENIPDPLTNYHYSVVQQTNANLVFKNKSLERMLNAKNAENADLRKKIAEGATPEAADLLQEVNDLKQKNLDLELQNTTLLGEQAVSEDAVDPMVVIEDQAAQIEEQAKLIEELKQQAEANKKEEKDPAQNDAAEPVASTITAQNVEAVVDAFMPKSLEAQMSILAEKDPECFQQIYQQLKVLKSNSSVPAELTSAVRETHRIAQEADAKYGTSLAENFGLEELQDVGSMKMPYILNNLKDEGTLNFDKIFKDVNRLRKAHDLDKGKEFRAKPFNVEQFGAGDIDYVRGEEEKKGLSYRHSGEKAVDDQIRENEAALRAQSESNRKANGVIDAVGEIDKDMLLQDLEIVYRENPKHVTALYTAVKSLQEAGSSPSSVAFDIALKRVEGIVSEIKEQQHCIDFGPYIELDKINNGNAQNMSKAERQEYTESLAALPLYISEFVADANSASPPMNMNEGR